MPQGLATKKDFITDRKMEIVTNDSLLRTDIFCDCKESNSSG